MVFSVSGSFSSTKFAWLHFLGIILCLNLILYSGILFGGYALYFRDIYHNYFPFLDFMAHSLQQGELPFWNPLVFNGTPQAAALEPPLFYPLGWIFFIGLPFRLALVTNLILHHLLAAVGFYLMGHELKWNQWTRLFAATFFCLGGIFVSMNNFHPLQNTVAWLPLVWWSSHRLFQQRDARSIVYFALCYALQILSGHLEIVYFESPLLLAYGFVCTQGELRIRLYTWLKFGLALLLGVGLSALQLGITLAYLPYSSRHTGMDISMIQLWSHHPWLSLLMVLPDYAGQNFQNYSLNRFFGEPEFGYTLFFVSLYAGVLVWILNFSGLLMIRSIRQSRQFIFFMLVGLFCLFLAFGKYTPLHALFLELPGSSFFRYPSKFLVFVSFCLALSGGIILQACFEQLHLTKEIIRVAIALVVLALIAFIGLQFGAPTWKAYLTEYIQQTRPQSDLKLFTEWLPIFQNLFQQQILIFSGLNLLVAGLFFYAKYRPERQNLIVGLLFLLVSLDLLGSGVNSLWMSKAELFEQPSEVARFFLDKSLNQHSQERLFVNHQEANISPSYRQELNGLQYARSSLYTHDIMDEHYSLKYQFKNLSGSWAGLSQGSNYLSYVYNQAFGHQKYAYILAYESLNSVRYLITSNKPKNIAAYTVLPGYSQQKVFKDIDVSIWENMHWLPRARFQDQAMILKTQKDMITAMSQPEVSGFDLQKQVLLLDNNELQQAREQIPASIAIHKHWSQPVFELERNNELKISFETNTSGYFVLADQHLPGWSVTDNGKPNPILTANYNQRAIRVGPGKHLIHFKYDPPGLKLGLSISLLSLIICILIYCLIKPHNQASYQEKSCV